MIQPTRGHGCVRLPPRPRPTVFARSRPFRSGAINATYSEWRYSCSAKSTDARPRPQVALRATAWRRCCCTVPFWPCAASKASLMRIRSPEKYRDSVIKRIVGVQGDYIAHRRTGRIMRVPDGMCWLEGDNPLMSRDSTEYAVLLDTFFHVHRALVHLGQLRPVAVQHDRGQSNARAYPANGPFLITYFLFMLMNYLDSF